jgi:hypothetical protein
MARVAVRWRVAVKVTGLPSNGALRNAASDEIAWWQTFNIDPLPVCGFGSSGGRMAKSFDRRKGPRRRRGEEMMCVLDHWRRGAVAMTGKRFSIPSWTAAGEASCTLPDMSAITPLSGDKQKSPHTTDHPD